MVSPSKTQQQKQERYKQPSEEIKSVDKRSCIRIQRGPKPLEKRSFYLDIKNHATAAKLESRIKDLGGNIELFLVRSVSVVASDRVDRTGYVTSEKRKWAFASGSGGIPSLRSIDAATPTPTQTPPTPLLSSEYPLSNSTNLRGSASQKTKSRVDAMLERALVQPQQCSVDPLDNAQSWGIPIWAVDKLQAWLDKIYVSLKDTEHLQDRKRLNQNNSAKDTKVRHLKGPYLKFESYHRTTRPVFLELSSWPTLNYHGEPGSCPFETRKKRDRLDCSKVAGTNDIKENCRQGIQPIHKEQAREMTRRSRAAVARARRTEQLAGAAGYCEICRIGYRDLNKHIQTDQHLNFVRNDDNFLSLDTLINAGANVEAFLKLNRSKSIEKDCSLFPGGGESALHGVVLPGGKVLKSSKPLAENFAIEDIKMVQCNGARRTHNLKLNSPSHNLRARARHESGHLLRSKGSPWHDVDKVAVAAAAEADKFYNKFEGFTIKKRAKGTIWVEEEDRDDNQFIQDDTVKNEYSGAKAPNEGSRTVRSFPTRKSEVVEPKKEETDLEELQEKHRSCVKRTPSRSSSNNRIDQEQEVLRGKSFLRTNGMVALLHADCQDSLNANPPVEPSRARNKKPVLEDSPKRSCSCESQFDAESRILEKEPAALRQYHQCHHQHHYHHHNHHNNHQQQQELQQSSHLAQNTRVNDLNRRDDAQGETTGKEGARVSKIDPLDQLSDKGALSQKDREETHGGGKSDGDGVSDGSSGTDGSAGGNDGRGGCVGRGIGGSTSNNGTDDRSSSSTSASTNTNTDINNRNINSSSSNGGGGGNGCDNGIDTISNHGGGGSGGCDTNSGIVNNTGGHGIADGNDESAGASNKCSKPNRRGGRNGAKGRHRLSVEERLIEDNRAYYKVEVLGSKLRSSVVSSTTGNIVPCFAAKDPEEVKQEATSGEKPVVVRFKRVRKSELSLLSDEAESFMFRDYKRENSSEGSDDERTSCETILPRETESSACNGSENSLLPSSSLGSEGSVKSEIILHEEDSQDSVGSLARARKRRRTQTEALLRDNTDYYKFETPGSRLRYQAPIGGIRESPRTAVAATGATTTAVTALARDNYVDSDSTFVAVAAVAAAATAVTVTATATATVAATAAATAIATATATATATTSAPMTASATSATTATVTAIAATTTTTTTTTTTVINTTNTATVFGLHSCPDLISQQSLKADVGEAPEEISTVVAQPISECTAPSEVHSDRIYPSKPSPEVEKMLFSFEAIPRSEPWYQTYQRQDEGAEYWHYFSDADTRKPFLLPYEIENFHDILLKCQNRAEAKRKNRGRGFGGCVGRSPRKSPRCHASTLAIMSTIIRKKEQLQLQQEEHQPYVPRLYTVDEHQPTGSWSNTPKSDSKSDIDDELRETARTIDEMLTAKDEDLELDERFNSDVGLAEMSLYECATDLPKGAPTNLLELLDNCQELTNCLENSSCASSECGEGGVESPLRRRKKRKNRTGWPDIKLKKKLNHNKSAADTECEREKQATADSCSGSWVHSNNKDCPFTLDVKITGASGTAYSKDFARTATTVMTTTTICTNERGTTAHGRSKENTVISKDLKNCIDKGVKSELESKVNDSSTEGVSGSNVSSEGNSRSETEDQLTTTNLTRDRSITHANTEEKQATAPTSKGSSTRPILESDGPGKEEYKFHRGSGDRGGGVINSETFNNDVGNDENHENFDYVFRKDGNLVSAKPTTKRRHRENAPLDMQQQQQHSSHPNIIGFDRDNCLLRSKDADPARVSSKLIQDANVVTGTITKRRAAQHRNTSAHRRTRTSRKRVGSGKRKLTRKVNASSGGDSTIFEDENCKKDSCLGISFRKQSNSGGTKGGSKRRGGDNTHEATAIVPLNTEIECALSDHGASANLVSSSELEQRRSSIDFQPVVRMMKIDQQVDVDHNVLAVTVASNRRLRSSSSPRSSSQPPRKRPKTTTAMSGSRGQFGRLLKGS